jgi:hypothetical protein
MWANNALSPAEFKFNVAGYGHGVYNPDGGTFTDVPTTPTDIYTSSSDEGAVQGMIFTITVSIKLPVSTPEGTYSTSLNFQSTTD